MAYRFGVWLLVKGLASVDALSKPAAFTALRSGFQAFLCFGLTLRATVRRISYLPEILFHVFNDRRPSRQFHPIAQQIVDAFGELRRHVLAMSDEGGKRLSDFSESRV